MIVESAILACGIAGKQRRGGKRGGGGVRGMTWGEEQYPTAGVFDPYCVLLLVDAQRAGEDGGYG